MVSLFHNSKEMVQLVLQSLCLELWLCRKLTVSSPIFIRDFFSLIKILCDHFFFHRHNLFLHSALVLSRKIPRSSTGIKEACRFYLIESGLALMVAFLINVSVISVSGAVCNASDLTPEDRAKCEDLDLNKASFLLRVTCLLRLLFLSIMFQNIKACLFSNRTLWVNGVQSYLPSHFLLPDRAQL